MIKKVLAVSCGRCQESPIRRKLQLDAEFAGLFLERFEEITAEEIEKVEV